MLRRTKYSRLRNDSLASLEDRPQRILTLKKDLCMDSDLALLDPGTPDHHEGPRLGGFTAPPRGLGEETTGDQTARGDHQETDWDRTLASHRLCRPPCSAEPLPAAPSAPSGTKRPVTLRRVSSLPPRFGRACCQRRDGLCFLETAAGAQTAQTGSGSVHHHIQVPVDT